VPSPGLFRPMTYRVVPAFKGVAQAAPFLLWLVAIEICINNAID
jgi:hypothetical protein